MPDEDRCELGGAVDLPLLTTTALDAVRAAGGVHQIAEGLIASISASVWSAVADVAIQPDLYSAQNGEDATSRLRKAAQLRLADTHADLFHVALTRSAPKKRLRDTLEKLREVKPERVWQPRRPKLAIEIASLIQREVGLAHVPDEKAAQCTLPLKIFAKEVAAFLKNNPHASDFSEKSLVYAVNEVCAAVVGEAEAVRAVERANELVVEDVGAVALHGSTDAAWAGTAARGSGIAMDDEGKERVLEAAKRVAERLHHPLKLCKLSTLPR